MTNMIQNAKDQVLAPAEKACEKAAAEGKNNFPAVPDGRRLPGHYED